MFKHRNSIFKLQKERKRRLAEDLSIKKRVELLGKITLESS
jgi:hypothetical protein